MRLDVWLDIACLFKTRSEAKRACEGGKVEVGGEHAKPNRAVREGDRIAIEDGRVILNGRRQQVQILFAKQHQASSWFNPELLAIPLEAIRDLKPVLTMVGGKVFHDTMSNAPTR